MRRLIALLCLLTLAAPVSAVIIRLTALAEVIQESTFILLAKVESIDAKRPAMVLAVDEVLKGKPGLKKLPVLLKGDAGAIKRKEAPQLLKRVAPKLPLVVFGSQRGKSYTAFGYSNGTWFSLTGTAVEGEVRWSFAHLEPYLQRMYRGTTAAMTQVVRDVLAGKAKAPPPDKKGKPGLGPEVEKKESGVRSQESGTEAPRHAAHFSVIPTVVIGGPLAMLAMLFPTWFGGWQRWLVLLSTAATNSTLFTLQWWFLPQLAGTWWGRASSLWMVMTLVNVAGLVWAWHRHVRRVESGAAPLGPGGVEVLVLFVVSVLGAGLLEGLRQFEQPLLKPEWLPVTALVGAVWLGTLVALAQWLRGPRLLPRLSSEAVVLTGLVLSGVALAPMLSTASTGADSAMVKQLWVFRAPGKAALTSSPLAVGGKVYVAAAHDDVFRPYGALYCLDAETGEVVWSFNDDRRMRQVHSSPTLYQGRLYIGEGFHQDDQCKVYCLDAETGAKVWEHQTGSHTESTPVLVEGRVYCGAGDDGLYCLDAETGKPVWNFPAFHFDAEPVVVNGRVYVGCGVGDVFKTTMLFCLDAKTGKQVWRYPTEQAVWGRAWVRDGRVYFGTGSGRINEDGPGAGSVFCVSADKGQLIWRKKMRDGVMASISGDAQHLYLGCRDGLLYCLDREDGGIVWRRKMGGPVVAEALLARDAETGIGTLYAAAMNGLVGCLDSTTGELLWGVDLARKTGLPVEVIATPARQGRRLYVALTMQSTGRIGELHCYEE